MEALSNLTEVAPDRDWWSEYQTQTGCSSTRIGNTSLLLPCILMDIPVNNMDSTQGYSYIKMNSQKEVFYTK